MRLLTTATVSIGHRAHPAGGFLDERGRTTRHPAHSDLAYNLARSSRSGSAPTVEPTRSLTTDQIFQVYRRVPDVRAAIDSITRRVSTADFYVSPIEGVVPEEMQEEALEVSRTLTRWFRAPMLGKTWQTWATMVVQDLLLYDATAWEKVKGSDGVLEELFPTRGDDWWPIIDTAGRVEKMEQRINGQATEYDPAEIVYLNLFPNTTTPRGMPLIETIVTEVIAILRGAERAMLTLDASEIPPGILYLTGVAGKAAEDTIQSFVKDKGRDHKMRVLHFPQKGAGEIQWLRLDSSPKELEMREVIEQIRRTIWRVFGVFPVEMGATDGMPRATAEVQIDASASHLIVPILELLQETISTQVLPLLVDEKWVGLLEFAFDFTRDLSPAEEKTLAEKDKILVDAGLLTRNEVRANRGYSPVEAGDVMTVSGTNTPLERALEGPAIPPPMPGEDPKDPEDSEDPEDPEGGDPAPGEEDGDGQTPEDGAPGEVGDEKAKGTGPQGMVHREHEHGPGCGCSQRTPGDSGDLPSDWQPAGRFRGKRTLDLSKLGLLVSRYDRTIRPLYQQARDEVVAAVRAAYADGEITTAEAARVTGDLTRTLSSLSETWDSETLGMYQEAVEIGDHAARTFAGYSHPLSAKERANLYSQRAMGFLRGEDGPLENIRHRVIALLGEVARSAVPDEVRAKNVTIPDEIAPGVSSEVLLAAVVSAFDANEHRIANWSGKLIELAGETAKEGMVESGVEVTSGKKTEWMVEWASVGDEEVCSTCKDLGSRGFIPLRSLPTIPGGATRCGARDRCVLVYWTEEEVRGGRAELLGGGNTGEPL